LQREKIETGRREGGGSNLQSNCCCWQYLEQGDDIKVIWDQKLNKQTILDAPSLIFCTKLHKDV
jgi:hypothetical protein